MRWLLATACLLLIIPTIMVYRIEQARTRPAHEFVSHFSVAIRRPEVAMTVDYTRAAEFATEAVADCALRDAYEPVDLNALTSEQRDAWINAASSVDSELAFTREALLQAIASRPGWPFYQSLLGQTVYATDTRSYDPALIRQYHQWQIPLRQAAADAPAVDSIWQSLAAGYLQTWPLLGPAFDSDAPHVFQASFSNPEFVRGSFATAAQVLGDERAIRYLPDAPRTLAIAFDYYAGRRDVEHAWPLRRRWDGVEWNARIRDLKAIEERASGSDIDQTRQLCNAWLNDHSVWDYDSPAAHDQAARLLTLWAPSGRGPWLTDPYADVVRYLLSRNGAVERYGAAVSERIDAFDGVPSPVVAEAKLLAGNPAEADRLATSADDAGSFSWVPYWLTSARLYGLSEALLRRLPPSAAQMRELLLLRGVPLNPGIPIKLCSSDTEIPAAGAPRRRTIPVMLSSTTPSIVDVGVNRARAGSALVATQARVSLTVTGPRDVMIWSRARIDGGACATVQAP